MSSYDEIRKMGEVSEQLKKHGLAKDNGEALSKAEGIMTSKGSDFYVSQDKLKDVESKTEEKKETSGCCENNKEELTKINKRINDRVTSVESQVNMIRDKVNEIISKINDIENKVNAQPRQEVQSRLVNSGSSEESNNAQGDNKGISEDNQKKEVASEEKKDHARSGKYNSNDVAVDKVFYSGSGSK